MRGQMNRSLYLSLSLYLSTSLSLSLYLSLSLWIDSRELGGNSSKTEQGGMAVK